MSATLRNLGNPVITTLKGLAVLWIASFHFRQFSWLDFSFPQGSYITVDLNFLVANGDLGFGLLLFLCGFSLFAGFARGHFSGDSPPGWGTFFRGAVLRFVPGYLLALMLAFFFFPDGLHHGGQVATAVITHLTFTHNLFPTTSGSILEILWIFGVLAQFCLIFPLLCKGFLKHPLLTLLISLTLAWAYRMLMVNFWVESGAAFLNQLPGFLDLFVSGMATAYFVEFLERHRPVTDSWRGIFTLLTVFVGALCILLLKDVNKLRIDLLELYRWQAANRGFMCLLYCLFTIFATQSCKLFMAVFTNRVLLFLGSISFPFLIWHQKLAQLFFDHGWLPGTETAPHGGFLNQMLFTLLVFFVSLLVATVLRYGFEEPLAAWARRKRKAGEGSPPEVSSSTC